MVIAYMLVSVIVSSGMMSSEFGHDVFGMVSSGFPSSGFLYGPVTGVECKMCLGLNRVIRNFSIPDPHIRLVTVPYLFCKE